MANAETNSAGTQGPRISGNFLCANAARSHVEIVEMKLKACLKQFWEHLVRLIVVKLRVQ